MANIIRPTTGLLVATSYCNAQRKGGFLIADLRLNKIISNREFNDIASSDNLMGFISFAEAFKYLNETKQSDANVYCSNVYAVRWANTLECKTRVHDKQIDPIINDTLEILKKHGQFSKVHAWEYMWGSAKELVTDIFWSEQEEAYYNGRTE